MNARAMRDLLALADVPMSKPADMRYQRRCADAAVIAHGRGWRVLARQLEHEAMTCHWCHNKR